MSHMENVPLSASTGKHAASTKFGAIGFEACLVSLFLRELRTGKNYSFQKRLGLFIECERRGDRMVIALDSGSSSPRPGHKHARSRVQRTTHEATRLPGISQY